MPSWEEERGNVSRAFDEWKLTDRDQRAFLHLGLEFAAVEYDRLWKEAGEEPGWDGGPEQLDSFEQKVRALWEHDYAWMHLSGVLRDAVSNFEVYLEKAREEVLTHQGKAVGVPDNSPYWKELTSFFRQIGADVRPENVEPVLALRNVLVHRRGELRTEKLRQEFQATHDDVIPPWTVDLDKERVLEAMGELATAAGKIDSAVYLYGWGGKRLENLEP